MRQLNLEHFQESEQKIVKKYKEAYKEMLCLNLESIHKEKKDQPLQMIASKNGYLSALSEILKEVYSYNDRDLMALWDEICLSEYGLYSTELHSYLIHSKVFH